MRATGAVSICQICHRTSAFGPIKHDLKWHESVAWYEKADESKRIKLNKSGVRTQRVGKLTNIIVRDYSDFDEWKRKEEEKKEKQERKK